MHNIVSVEDSDADIAARTANTLGKYHSNYEEPGRQLLLLYGTEYGFSEEIARKLFDRISEDEDFQALSVQPRVLNCKYYERVDLSKEQVALCVFSTTGDGKSFMYLCTTNVVTFPPETPYVTGSRDRDHFVEKIKIDYITVFVHMKVIFMKM